MLIFDAAALCSSQLTAASVQASRGASLQMCAPPDCRGRLCFGAARAPSTWLVDRDGPWNGGYWVEIEGGEDDGLQIALLTENIEAGVKEGDLCYVVEEGESGVRCLPIPVAERSDTFRFGAKAKRQRKKLISDIGRPVSILAIVLAAATLFTQNTPSPGGAELAERCERLITGSVATGDRRAAERWLSMCDLPSGDAEQLLADAWLRRWGEDGPPQIIQGVPVKLKD